MFMSFNWIFLSNFNKKGNSYLLSKFPIKFRKKLGSLLLNGTASITLTIVSLWSKFNYFTVILIYTFYFKRHVNYSFNYIFYVRFCSVIICVKKTTINTKNYYYCPSNFLITYLKIITAQDFQFMLKILILVFPNFFSTTYY